MTGKYLVECIAGRLRGHGLVVTVVEVYDHPPPAPPVRLRLTARAGVAEVVAEHAEIRAARERLISLAVEGGFDAKSLIPARVRLEQREAANKVWDLSREFLIADLDDLSPYAQMTHVYEVTSEILASHGLIYEAVRPVLPEEAPLDRCTSLCFYADGTVRALPEETRPLFFWLPAMLPAASLSAFGGLTKVFFDAHWMLVQETGEERLVYMQRPELPTKK